MEEQIDQSLSPKRLTAAVLVALLGSVIVWVAVPYNKFLLKNSYVADSFLPEIVVAFLLVLFAAVIPSNGHEPEWELFDLENDPREMNNVVHDLAYAAIRRQLSDQLHQLQAEYGDQRYSKDI